MHSNFAFLIRVSTLQVIKLDPKNYEAYNHRGLALMALGPEGIEKSSKGVAQWFPRAKIGY